MAEPFDITLAAETLRESQTRAQLLGVLAAYDVERWTRTRRIVIEQGVVPFSHPVIHLNTRHLDHDELLLSTFLHEQIHWIVAEDQTALANAMVAVSKQYPSMSVTPPDGAADVASTHLHVIVNYLELAAMRELVGEELARRVIEHWAGDHYRAIYRSVLDHETEIAELIGASGLRCP